MAKSALLPDGVPHVLFYDDDVGAYFPGISLVNSEGIEQLYSLEGALVTTDFAHSEVHESNMFISSYKTPEGSDLADNASIFFFFVVGSKDAHTTFLIQNGGDAEFILYEGCSGTASGTSLAVNSVNRATLGVTNDRMFLDPTLSHTGTKLVEVFVPGGSGPTSPGLLARRGTEWVFKRNTAYGVRLINRAGTAQIEGIEAEWYRENIG